jgi:hypothetical protein
MQAQHDTEEVGRSILHGAVVIFIQTFSSSPASRGIPILNLLNLKPAQQHRAGS